MWPFNKRQAAQPEPLPPGPISYSQLDITERFGDNLGLAQDEWIATIPLNSMTQDPESVGLPLSAPADPARLSGRAAYTSASAVDLPCVGDWLRVRAR